MKRATTSLPVPDSPVRSTVVSVSATSAAFFSVSIHSGDPPATAMSLSLIPQAANGFSSADGPYTDGTD
jgi:hypothetical protein